MSVVQRWVTFKGDIGQRVAMHWGHRFRQAQSQQLLALCCLLRLPPDRSSDVAGLLLVHGFLHSEASQKAEVRSCIAIKTLIMQFCAGDGT